MRFQSDLAELLVVFYYVKLFQYVIARGFPARSEHPEMFSATAHFFEECASFLQQKNGVIEHAGEARGGYFLIIGFS